MWKFGNKKTITEDFIIGLMNFIPDIRLIPINQQVRTKNQERLAASGNGNGHHTIRKIGLLTDPEKTITARIMEDKSRSEYQIYFLLEEEQSLQYSILSNPNTGKYFIINENEYTTIPKSANIDPLNDELVISYAKDIFSFDATESMDCILVGENGNRLLTSYDTEQKSIVCNLVPNDEQNSENYKKLLLYSSNDNGDYVRLVPIIHNRAVIPIDSNIKKVFVFCLYL